MLKQFAWQDATMFRIFAKRAKEMGALRKRGFLIALNTSVVSLFTCLLPSITFSAFIGLGNTLDFATAVSSLVLFQLMIGPLFKSLMIIEPYMPFSSVNEYAQSIW